jgi:DNA-binding transcriptional regulator/RsmH inhibitor MraZ
MDEKDRVVFPLALRKCVDEDERESVLAAGFMVRPSDTNEYLEMFPRDEYDRYIESLEARYSPEDELGQSYLRFFTSRVEPVDLDRQFRFAIPESAKVAASLGKDLVFVGRTRKIEIWPGRAGRTGRSSTASERSLRPLQGLLPSLEEGRRGRQAADSAWAR